MGRLGQGITGGTPEELVNLARLAIEHKSPKCQANQLVLLLDWGIIRPPDWHIDQMHNEFRDPQFQSLAEKFLGVYIICRDRNIQIKPWNSGVRYLIA